MVDWSNALTSVHSRDSWNWPVRMERLFDPEFNLFGSRVLRDAL